MKTVLKSFFFLFMIFFLAGSVDSYSQVEKKTEKSAKAEKKVIFNAYCPVTGDEIDAEGKTVEYKGKTIAFCCKSCLKKFNKQPEKYMKNLSEDGKKFIGKPAPMH